MKKIDIHYGFTFIYPDDVCKIIVEPLTKWQKINRFCTNAIEEMIPAFLFAAAVACFQLSIVLLS